MAKEIKKPSFDLSDKVAIVTGGTKGIGYAIASTFAMYGCNVVITSRTPDDCERIAKDINTLYGVKCLGIAADSSNKENIGAVVAKTVEAFGKIDILINNAGISGKTASLLEQTEDNFMKVINTNLKGCFLFANAVAAQMVKQGKGGKIVNIASVGGLIGGKSVAPYGASKAGVLSLTKTMANEWARYGITVNAVCPGYVITELNEDIFANPEIKAKMEKRTAVRRLGCVEEIAGPVLAMVSDCFSYMTGTYILLDGGQTIGG
ncbi:SDR family NAD(P)-dependent oxidoreductase [Sporomusa acidovorans]|uniref:2-dehydro-3-deoxy-D-gluconate 5-dehydrogenase n=1 Tax=Sporomusa acidovorans (strain ATCC 49682 / DSM 3132 / Mol) TaxID=1123286 RepID=A0ABZ3IZH0_SPOA4|nr:glucose 1-dehydrogenase [Sporomusa acidovorans]OZC21975.1 2-dehydro-3-deoxy-D-gluconate 5-dehydrogenase [Sporomusa acidovorans DSM 3132]SDF65070.1 NAD(P)-dependent dehydrogenase, short-chain alcohol dehydrogenase family [Sporomusa acidovorans]